MPVRSGETQIIQMALLNLYGLTKAVQNRQQKLGQARKLASPPEKEALLLPPMLVEPAVLADSPEAIIPAASGDSQESPEAALEPQEAPEKPTEAKEETLEKVEVLNDSDWEQFDWSNEIPLEPVLIWDERLRK